MMARLNLICIDGSMQSEKAFTWYCNHIHRQGDTVGLLNLCKMPNLASLIMSNSSTGEADIQKVSRQAKAIVEKFKGVLAGTGVPHEVFIESAQDSVAKTIINIAKEKKASLIVMAQHGINVCDGSKKGTESHPMASRDVVLGSEEVATVIVPAPSQDLGDRYNVDQRSKANENNYSFMNQNQSQNLPAASNMGYVGNQMPAGDSLGNTNTPDLAAQLGGLGSFGGAGFGAAGMGTAGFGGLGAAGFDVTGLCAAGLGGLSGPGFPGNPGLGVLGNLPGHGMAGLGLPGNLSGPGMSGGLPPPMANAPPPRVHKPRPSGVGEGPYTLYCWTGEPISPEQLYEMFQQFGPVHKVDVKEGKGYGFAHMINFWDAADAVNHLEGQILPGLNKPMQVKFKDNRLGAAAQEAAAQKSKPPPEGAGSGPYKIYCWTGEMITNDDLYAIFQKFGTISDVDARLDKGFGFVTMPNYWEATDAIKNLHDRHCLHFKKRAQVKFKEVRSRNDNRDGDRQNERAPKRSSDGFPL